MHLTVLFLSIGTSQYTKVHTTAKQDNLETEQVFYMPIFLDSGTQRWEQQTIYELELKIV